MTNGDFDCIHDGLRRQRESIAGLAALGVAEEHVIFLGYPDGSLAKLGSSPLTSRRIEAGRCIAGSTTYGSSGFGGRDYHAARSGQHAAYTRSAVVSDLAQVLAELRPSNVVVTHGSDTHPDHAATWTLFRSALDQLQEAPLVHRAIVHNGDCWPTGSESHEPCPPGSPEPSVATPALSGRLLHYEARERLAVPESCRSPDRAANPKVRAIAAHASQTRGDERSYLFSFARADEAFYPESYHRKGARWQKTSAPRLAALPVVQRFESPSSRAVAHAAPLSIAARVREPPQGPDVERRVLSVSFLADGAGEYRLEIDAARREVRFLRRQATGPATVLQVWPMPHDAWSTAEAEEFEIEFEPIPEDGPVAEVTLRLRGQLLGVAVDASPRLSGASFAISGGAEPGRTEVVLRAAAGND
jgi:LmbE family N-acetylglucosaminyl deacetylase